MRTGQPCKVCGIPYSEEFISKKKKQKSLAMIEARRIAKINGEPVGAPRKYDREKIRALRKSGASYRGIAKELNCSTGAVTCALKEKP